MQLYKRHIEIIQALYEQNIGLAKGDDDQRKELTRRIAEQICFEFGLDWGTKASSRTSPQSKDAIAYKEPGKLSSWDWQNGATREPQVHVGQEGEDVTNQFFIQVDPINHLKSAPIDNGDDNSDITSLLESFNEIIKQVKADQAKLLQDTTLIMESLTIILNKVDKPGSSIKFPEYEGSNRFLGTFTLKPKQ